jgi:adenylate cyclase
MTGRAAVIGVVILLTAAWSGLLGVNHWRGGNRLIDRFEGSLTDMRFLLRGPKPSPEVVTIVAIDDAAVEMDGRYPLSRSTLATLVDTIARHKPKLVVLDILLFDAGPDEGADRALARALERGPSVIAAAAIFSGARQALPARGRAPLERVPRAERFLYPLEIFAEAAAVGIANIATDDTGTPRLIPMVFRNEQQIEPSLSLLAAALATSTDPLIEENVVRFGNRFVLTDFGQHVPLGYYGPSGTISTVSAAEVLRDEVAGGMVKDRVVVVGATVTGGGDVFSTPFDPVLPGAEVLSTAITNLMTGDGLARDWRIRLADASIAGLLAIICVSLVSWRRNALGFTMIGAVVCIWGIGNFAAFANGIWLSAALPLAAALPPVVVAGATQIWLDRRRATALDQEGKMLRRFQAPALGAWLSSHPDFLQKPVRQDAAIVFVDLSGFTGLSEALGPEPVSELLDSFYDLISDEATTCGGAITSFMGDGAMIVFGLPEPQADDAKRAAACSIELAMRIRDWLVARSVLRSPGIGFKIGAHFGPIMASRLGQGRQQHITATGDTVNVSARLLEVAAQHGAEMAVSDQFFRAAGATSALHTRGVLEGPREVSIRGRSGSQATWLWRSEPLARRNQG